MGGIGGYSRWLCCHSEELQKAGVMGWQEAREAHEREVLSPAPGEVYPHGPREKAKALEILVGSGWALRHHVLVAKKASSMCTEHSAEHCQQVEGGDECSALVRHLGDVPSAGLPCTGEMWTCRVQWRAAEVMKSLGTEEGEKAGTF